jgi:hypothetical protein
LVLSQEWAVPPRAAWPSDADGVGITTTADGTTAAAWAGTAVTGATTCGALDTLGVTAATTDAETVVADDGAGAVVVTSDREPEPWWCFVGAAVEVGGGVPVTVKLEAA